MTTVNISEVQKLVCVAHGVQWTEWLESSDKPKCNSQGLYKLKDVYAWLGY